MTQTVYELKRVLSTGHLIVLGISSIVGSGVFVLTGLVASSYAGPGVTLSFILSGIACMCVALCYVELATTIPRAGGLYSYAVTLLSPRVSLLFAAVIIPSTLFSMSGVTVSCVSYFGSFLSSIHAYDTLDVLTSLQTFHLKNYSMDINIPALGLVALITLTLLSSNKSSITIAFVLVAIKLSIIIGFVVLGFIYLDSNNWKPFIPPNEGVYGKFGLSGVISGASMLILSYCGFEAMGTAAQEVKNPEKALPRGIITSFIICIIIYTLVSLAMTGLVSYRNLNVLYPIAVAIKSIDIPWLESLTLGGIVMGLMSVLLAVLFGLSRVLYAVARDGTISPVFAKCNRRGIPYMATLTLTSILAVISSSLPTQTLIQCANFGYLTMFMAICVLVIVLRKKHGPLSVKESFKCPGVPLVPIFAIVLLSKMWFALLADVYPFVVCWLTIILLGYTLIYSKNLIYSKKESRFVGEPV